jgi:Ribbon-helix-helix domain
MKGIHLTLREEQLKALKKLSQETGAPVNELIRRAIDGYLKGTKKA